MVGGLGGRCKFGEALDGCIGESGQDVSEVVAHRDTEPAASFDDEHHGSDTPSGLRAADMDPVCGSVSQNCLELLRYTLPAIPCGLGLLN